MVQNQTNNCHTNPELDYSNPPPHYVTTTHEGIKTITLFNQQYLQPDINTMSTISNPSNNKTPSTSTTTVSPSYPSEHALLFPNYESNIIPDMIHQLGVK